MKEGGAAKSAPGSSRSVPAVPALEVVLPPDRCGPRPPRFRSVSQSSADRVRFPRSWSPPHRTQSREALSSQKWRALDPNLLRRGPIMPRVTPLGNALFSGSPFSGSPVLGKAVTLAVCSEAQAHGAPSVSFTPRGFSSSDPPPAESPPAESPPSESPPAESPPSESVTKRVNSETSVNSW